MLQDLRWLKGRLLMHIFKSSESLCVWGSCCCWFQQIQKCRMPSTTLFPKNRASGATRYIRPPWQSVDMLKTLHFYSNWMLTPLLPFFLQKTLFQGTGSRSPSMASKQQHQPSAASILESLFRSSAPGMSTFRVLYNLEVYMSACTGTEFCNIYHLFSDSKSRLMTVISAFLSLPSLFVGVEFKAHAHIRWWDGQNQQQVLLWQLSESRRPKVRKRTHLSGVFVLYLMYQQISHTGSHTGTHLPLNISFYPKYLTLSFLFFVLIVVFLCVSSAVWWSMSCRETPSHQRWTMRPDKESTRSVCS